MEDRACREQQTSIPHVCARIHPPRHVVLATELLLPEQLQVRLRDVAMRAIVYDVVDVVQHSIISPLPQRLETVFQRLVLALVTARAHQLAHPRQAAAGKAPTASRGDVLLAEDFGFLRGRVKLVRFKSD